MTQSKLKEQYKSYLASQARIRDRQHRWLNDTQPQLLSILNEILTTHQIKASVEVEKGTSNMKPIVFSLGTADSGLSLLEGTDLLVPYVKDLGALFYTPIHNGNVTVLARLPVIKNLMQAQTPKVIDVLAPDSLSKEKVEAHLVQFFQLLEDWEAQVKETNPIGF